MSAGRGRVLKRLVRRAWTARGVEEACVRLQGYVGTVCSGQEATAVGQTAGKMGLQKSEQPCFSDVSRNA